VTRLTLPILVALLLLAGTLEATAEPRVERPTWDARKRAELRVERDALRMRVRNLRRIANGKFDTPESHALERAFLCIHRYEGSWTDPNAPYWGGLQMDRAFMRTYGRPFYDEWGTADNWPVSAQVGTAMRAYVEGRGFYPWPNTARYCGLLP
jgi:hypothetical protein